MIFENDSVGAIHELPLPKTRAARRRMLLPKIIGRFKMNSAKNINVKRNTPGVSVWQRNYFEHIIRNEKSLNRIREYIAMNPEQWEFDKENPACKDTEELDEWLLPVGTQPVRNLSRMEKE